MASQTHLKAHLERAVLMTDVQEDKYLGDILSDECVLLEELETDDFLTATTSANEDLWDMLDISNDDWENSQSDGFFIY